MSGVKKDDGMDRVSWSLSRTALVAVAVGLAHTVVVHALGTLLTRGIGSDGDVYYYHDMAALAYKGSSWDTYPAGAMVAFMAPFLFDHRTVQDAESYKQLFFALNAIYSGTIAALVFVIQLKNSGDWRKAVRSFLLFSTFALTGCMVYLWRFDLFAALVTTAGMSLFLIRRPKLSIAILVFGTLVKLYSGLVLIVFAMESVLRRRLTIARLIAISAFAVAAIAALVTLSHGSLILAFMKTSLARPIENGSVIGSALLLASLFGARVDAVNEHSSWTVRGPLPDAVAPWIPMLMAVAVGMAAWWALSILRREARVRAQVSFETLVELSVVLIAAFMLTNKVMPCQYLVWLAPFFSLLPARRAGIFFAIVVLATVVDPYGTTDLFRGRLVPTLTMNVRSALFLYLTIDLVRGAETRLAVIERETPAPEGEGPALASVITGRAWTVLLLPAIASVWALLCLVALPRFAEWRGRYYVGRPFEREVFRRSYSALSFHPDVPRGPLASQAFSARFDECLEVHSPRAASFTFSAAGDARVLLDDREFLALAPSRGGAREAYGDVDLSPGVHHVSVEFVHELPEILPEGSAIVRLAIAYGRAFNGADPFPPDEATLACAPRSLLSRLVGARVQRLWLATRASQ